MGSIGYTVALQELNNAVDIDNIIAVIDSKTVDIAKKEGIDKAKVFKAQMEAKYSTIKFSKDKKVVKEINEDIDRQVHPEHYVKIEKDTTMMSNQ